VATMKGACSRMREPLGESSVGSGLGTVWAALTDEDWEKKRATPGRVAGRAAAASRRDARKAIFGRASVVEMRWCRVNWLGREQQQR